MKNLLIPLAIEGVLLLAIIALLWARLVWGDSDDEDESEDERDDGTNCDDETLDGTEQREADR